MADVHIICDTTESRCGIPHLLSERPNVRAELRDLDLGDYQIGERAVIERKSASDFIASIMDRRIFAQMEMMTASCDIAVVLVEGDVFASRSAIEPAALEGALSWIAVLSGAQLMFSGSAAQSASMIATMARHCQQGLGYIPALRSGKPTATQASVITRYVLEGLPGVGATTAITLAKHFQTIQAVANASLDDLKSVDGIGQKTALKVYQAMRGEQG